MHISPDSIILWQYGWINLNLTIITSWGLILLLTLGSWLLTRRLANRDQHSRLHNILEIVVLYLLAQLAESGLKPARRYLPFIGTLFIFIAVTNLLVIIPGYQAPTASLSTTAALALAVFVAVPYYGVSSQGVSKYLRSYLQPVWIMLPFNLIGEFTRTLALAVRLFGNMMSGAMIGAILLLITPLIFPVLMSLLGLLTGMVQAYIFAILALVYISAATQTHPSSP